MVFKLAWRNIWRNRTRSMIVVGSIVIGIWALVFLLGFLRGQVNNYVSNIIENETSHIQIHQKDFKEDFEPGLFVSEARQMGENLLQNSEVDVVGRRIILNGMLASSAAAQGVVAKGVIPEEENQLTKLSSKIIEGQYFDDDKRNQILISQRMADKLKVKIRSKVVLTFQNIAGEITTAAFRIQGIYKTVSRNNDELYVFIKFSDLQRLIEMPESAAHQLAILVHDFDQTDTIAVTIAGQYPDELVESYKEISPDLELFNSQIKLNMRIMTTIFMLALIFGIINTMLMAVLERIKELGMLMAVGMNKVRVFGMVVYETIFISLLGAPIGMLLGYFTTQYLNHIGINLSRWSSALEEFGMSDVVRPVVDQEAFVTIAVAVVITAVLASIYPAFKAIRLKPVEALRKI